MAFLEEGNIAPNFTEKNQNGEEISLSQYKGKKVILYFYPKDNTPGCTAESCNLRDNYNNLLNKGFEVIGISPDSEKSHLNFSSKHNLPFNLIADTEKSILKAYGAWGLKKLYGREYEGVGFSKARPDITISQYKPEIGKDIAKGRAIYDLFTELNKEVK